MVKKGKELKRRYSEIHSVKTKSGTKETKFRIFQTNDISKQNEKRFSKEDVKLPNLTYLYCPLNFKKFNKIS